MSLPLSYCLKSLLWRMQLRVPSELPTFCDDALGSCWCAPRMFKVLQVNLSLLGVRKVWWRV
jgi:hypothetical protein